MAGFELTEWIDRKPEEVFEFITDPGNAPKINEGIKEMVQLTDGPRGEGTRFREKRVMNGKEAEAELEVFRYLPPRYYGVSNEQEGIQVTYLYTLTPERGGTNVHLECTVQAKGLRRALVGIVAGILKKEDGTHLHRLKLAVTN
jgi:hypothetical protein